LSVAQCTFKRIATAFNFSFGFSLITAFRMAQRIRTNSGRYDNVVMTESSIPDRSPCNHFTHIAFVCSHCICEFKSRSMANNCSLANIQLGELLCTSHSEFDKK
uniref:Secreted protein n=1 Tax=Haemonchus placei TaxID=6290 RepID=A0A0N4X4G3_HAEPC